MTDPKASLVWLALVVVNLLLWLILAGCIIGLVQWATR